ESRPEPKSQKNQIFSSSLAGIGFGRNRRTCSPFLGYRNVPLLVDPKMFCSLQGDAGAPLFCRKHDSYFLFGVVTWGSWRCSANKPAIFTRVADFLSWISDVIDV
uniref:Peptidase S1 domain-containing protein n=1 Tax=Oryzias latipes TaxID=8090 RepID=A0A3P9K1P9_ORYLA